MNTLSQQNQIELENIFANNFKTPQFLALAKIYFESNDLDRAAKVCEIGLNEHSKNLDARYMLAKIYLLNNQINKSEQFLSKSLNNNLISIKMLRLFIEIRDSLNRSKNETKKIIDILLKKESDNTFANLWLHHYNSTQKNIIQKVESTFKINKNIISYTFYNVLKAQKNYNQAGLVLDMLKDHNKIDIKIYKQEYKIISKLLKS
tara:strand:- start:15144 stop:15758 length:615 start_codon:yes stop_codon:yes gene_type:complete